jgi:hypothetical protein
MADKPAPCIRTVVVGRNAIRAFPELHVPLSTILSACVFSRGSAVL